MLKVGQVAFIPYQLQGSSNVSQVLGRLNKIITGWSRKGKWRDIQLILSSIFTEGNLSTQLTWCGLRGRAASDPASCRLLPSGAASGGACPSTHGWWNVDGATASVQTCGLGCGNGGRVLHSILAKSQSPHSPGGFHCTMAQAMKLRKLRFAKSVKK